MHEGPPPHDLVFWAFKLDLGPSCALWICQGNSPPTSAVSVSVGMTGDNYTSDRFQTLQSAVKTAAAIAVSGPLANKVMLWFFQLFCLVLNCPVRIRFHIFSCCDAAAAALASGCSGIKRYSLNHPFVRFVEKPLFSSRLTANATELRVINENWGSKALSPFYRCIQSRCGRAAAAAAFHCS